MYTLTLEQGLQTKVLLESEDSNKIHEMFEDMKTEISGSEKLCIYNPTMITYFKAIKGNPFDEWESKRIEQLKKGKDMARNGDYSLYIRGIIEEIEENGRKYTSLKSGYITA